MRPVRDRASDGRTWGNHPPAGVAALSYAVGWSPPTSTTDNPPSACAQPLRTRPKHTDAVRRFRCFTVPTRGARTPRVDRRDRMAAAARCLPERKEAS